MTIQSVQSGRCTLSAPYLPFQHGHSNLWNKPTAFSTQEGHAHRHLTADTEKHSSHRNLTMRERSSFLPMVWSEIGIGGVYWISGKVQELPSTVKHCLAIWQCCGILEQLAYSRISNVLKCKNIDRTIPWNQRLWTWTFLCVTYSTFCQQNDLWKVLLHGALGRLCTCPFM